VSAETVVEIRDLTKRYDTVTAVDQVSLSVRRGEVYGFLGPNGAGKTTTLRMLLGLIRPTSGDITVLGRRPGDAGALERIGSMIEGPAFYPFLSGRANLEVVALVGEGLNNDEIGARLFMSPATAKTHVSRAMSKLHARDRAQLVVIAYESGLVRPGWS
jgi:ABC-type multidrug transport system ATPase subunit